MKNFKEIAEKCLAGELSGIFIMRKDKPIHSNRLNRRVYLGEIIPNYYKLGLNIFNEKGDCIRNKERVEDFIPDTMTQKKIEIDIPEGKVPIMEQTENGVVITWTEKELTYKDIENKIILKNERDCIIGYTKVIEDIKTFNCPHSDFYKKVEVLRKLTNIRNYFGGDKPTNSWIITIDSALRPFVIKNPKPYRETCFIYFDTQEHAEQAIKMLGDEIKYLFEPW